MGESRGDKVRIWTDVLLHHPPFKGVASRPGGGQICSGEWDRVEDGRVNMVAHPDVCGGIVQSSALRVAASAPPSDYCSRHNPSI
jgi:hypothetical protein